MPEIVYYYQVKFSNSMEFEISYGKFVKSVHLLTDIKIRERNYFMETLALLNEFGLVNDKCKKTAEYIIKQNPMQYEEEYGLALVHWTDRNFLDMLIYKMRFYKMFSLGNVMSRYNIFYEYCVEKGYINHNPFHESKYLSTAYIQSEILESGNLPYYTRDYIKQKCLEYTDNKYYYLSIALSIYEGIRNFKELSKIKYSDIDFNTRKIDNYDGIVISKELLECYGRLHEMEYFESNQKRYFDDTDGLLIRRINKNGFDSLKTDNARNLSAAMQKVGLVQSVIYDSGLIYRLCNEIGKEKLIQYMMYSEETDKIYKIENNRELKKLFDKLGINMSVKNFVYDYRVYALGIKYGVIDI